MTYSEEMIKACIRKEIKKNGGARDSKDTISKR